MATTPTNNAVPSESPRDLKFNAGKIDEFVNQMAPNFKYTDRFGNEHLTIAGIENLVRQIVSSLGFVPFGTFEAGATLTDATQTLKYEADGNYYRWDGDFPKNVPADSTPDNTGGVATGAWVNVTDLTLRTALASDEGGKLVNTPRGTVSENLRNCANIESLGAEMIPADATAAFVSAYATGKPVYVPPGSWFTSVFYPDKTFGDGNVFSDESTYFSDSGQRPTSPAAKSKQQIVEHIDTWGNWERAAGRSLIVNNPDGRTQVSGFTSPSQYATYPNSDHVGYYIDMHGPRGQVKTTAASTTYTATTVTAPEIVTGAKIAVGMFVSTRHTVRYKSKILSIDFDTNTITVDGWYAVGDTSSGQIPASGFQAIINAADKLWGQNTVVFIDDDSTALTATGYELGFHVSTTPGNPVWGFHAVNYSPAYQLSHGYRVTGNFGNAFNVDNYSTNALNHSVDSVYKASSKTVAVQDITDTGWLGAVVSLNTSFRKATSRILEIITGGVIHFQIDSRGRRSAQRENLAVVSADTTLSGLSPSIVLCTNASQITLTMDSTNCIPGQCFEVRATNADVLIGAVTLNSSSRYVKLSYDGSSFVVITRAN